MAATDVNNTYASYSGLSLYSRYALAGSQCTALTHLIMVPADVIKTRLQLRPGAYKNMADAMKTITRTEGPRALLLGAAPTFFGYGIQGSFKFGVYEFFKHELADRYPAQAVSSPTLIYVASAAIAEVAGSVALCPWEALRIRTVSQPDFANGMIQGFIRLGRSEGLSGMYRGITPILLKQIPYTVTQLVAFQHAVSATYDHILPRFTQYKSKEQLSAGGQLAVSVGCGVVAGVISAIASHPADTILSKVNAQKSTKGPAAAVFDAMKQLGFGGLWYGLGARCVMVGGISAGMFLIYDSVKLACGLPTTSGLGRAAKIN